MTGPRPRRDVIELLAFHHPHLSDFSRKPWRLFHLDGGRPFTAEEAALCATATPAEVAAGVRLALAAWDRERRKRDDFARLRELLGMAISLAGSGGEDLPVPVLLALLPQAEQEEAARLLGQGDLQG